MYQLRNLINRRNVISNPKKNVYACEDFLYLLVHSHIVAAIMDLLKMSSTDSFPLSSEIPNDAWTWEKEKRKKLLDEILDQLLHYCQCVQPFQSPQTQTDAVFTYASELLTLGLFHMEFKQAIKEGDGGRVLRCWKYMLILFKGSLRKNYAIEALNLLYNYTIAMSPRQAEQLIWDRFINTKGQKGCNKSCDLHMEHLNRLLKDSINAMGANKTTTAIQRAATSIHRIQGIIQNFDENALIPAVSTAHGKMSDTRDRDIILKELMDIGVFCKSPQERFHPSFRKLKPLFNSCNYRTLKEWASEHLNI